MSANYSVDKKTEQQILQVKEDIAYLLKLVDDPKRYGELVAVLDPTVDRVNKCITKLQTRLTEEFDKKTREFEDVIKSLDDPSKIVGSEPPAFLSELDKATWHRFVTSNALKPQLADFKQALIDGFKNSLTKKLKIEELAEQNRAIRQILEKIRRMLLI